MMRETELNFMLKGEILTDDDVFEQIRVSRHVEKQKVRLKKGPEMKAIRVQRKNQIRNEQKPVTVGGESNTAKARRAQIPETRDCLNHLK